MPKKSFKTKRSSKQLKVAKKKSYGRRRTTAIMPNRLFRTFNYRKDFEASTDRTNESWNSSGLEVYGKTYPKSGIHASMAFLGSHCLTPLGVGTLIDSDGTNSFITENFPTGLSQYGAFYEHGMVHASSIRIDIQPFSADATAYRYVLLPIPVPAEVVSPDSSSYPSTNTGNGWRPMDSNVKLKLDAMPYYELSSQPRAKFGVINAPGAKPTIIKYKTMKTKAMLNIKDLRDNAEDFEMRLPYISGLTTDSPINYVATNNAARVSNIGDEPDEFKDFDTWIWYLRIFNIGQTGNDPSGLLSVSVRIKYMCELYDKLPIEITGTQEWPID